MGSSGDVVDDDDLRGAAALAPLQEIRGGGFEQPIVTPCRPGEQLPVGDSQKAMTSSLADVKSASVSTDQFHNYRCCCCRLPMCKRCHANVAPKRLSSVAL